MTAGSHWRVTLDAISSIDELRDKMEVSENKGYTLDYFDAEKRYIGNSVQVFFKDVNYT